MKKINLPKSKIIDEIDKDTNLKSRSVLMILLIILFICISLPLNIMVITSAIAQKISRGEKLSLSIVKDAIECVVIYAIRALRGENV
jgi:hypothetical protein